ncbi:type III-B CRISPR module-associated Cmr3 family protein [Stenoxybacter acetivorans]|uniref:type III-B CRISPR module-associated Cmr3 family protein n=1 Tax=Stenoxybacter acetivorans TaxID=422441 RepID=UPI000560F257|nr:type III-B CRISPR module-associated Cmr3 family protein [Stenoxybacter acetivorans]
MTKALLITPRDPLIFRDGRPFDSSLTTRIYVHRWPFPSVTAGALRTFAKKQKTDLVSKDLNKIDIRGPLPYLNNHLYVPAPADAVIQKKSDKYKLCRLLPEKMDNGCGVDLPFQLQPLLPKPSSENSNFRPDNSLIWWPLELTIQWLLGKEEITSEQLKACLTDLPLDERTHVKINPETGVAEPGLLFSTRGVDFMQQDSAGKTDGEMIEAALRVDRCDDISFSGVIPLGAERRLAKISECSKLSHLWDCPDEIKTALKGKNKHIKLQLATPAIFTTGWYPDWLYKELENCNDEKDNQILIGTIPKTEIQVKLIAASVKRAVPISGFSHDGNIKATKKMVPAGSVYFFEVLNPEVTTAALIELWLHPVCGQSFYHRQSKKCNPELGADGFGLALWGI